MLLTMDKLIQSELFSAVEIPSALRCSGINRFVFFEGNCSEAEFTPCSLIFFPRGTGHKMTYDFLSDLKKISCSGVFFETDPAMDQIREWAQFLSFPLLELPDTATISQTIERCYEIAYGEPIELASGSMRTMNRLFNDVVSHKSANERIIQTAMDMLECPIAFATSDFLLQKTPTIPKEYLIQVPFCSIDSTFEWEHALYGFDFASSKQYPCLAIGLDDTKIGGYLYQNDYTERQNSHVFIFPVRDASTIYGYLIVATDEEIDIIPPEQGIVIQQILVVLRLEVSKSAEVAQTINRYYDFILDELIESEHADFEKLMQKYSLAQKVIYDTYYVVIAGRSQPKTSTSPFHELLTSQQFNLLYSKLIGMLDTINFFIFERRDFIVLFIPGHLKPDKEFMQTLSSIFEDFFRYNLDGIGISNIVSKKAVHEAYYQAKKALAISAEFEDKRPFKYSDLGILEYFFNHEDEIDFGPLLDLHEEYLKPVLLYDENHGTDLLHTLDTYIKYCSSTSAICTELFIHKNTLYSRLNKISQILGKDLSDSDVIFHITFALKVRMMLKAGLLKSDQPPAFLMKQSVALDEQNQNTQQ